MSRLQELESKIQKREARIAVVGLGYVGLPLALAFARQGFEVFGIDLDNEKIEELNAGRSYIEDIPHDEVQEQVAAGRFEATSSFAALSRADCINICVPTPLRKTKDPDVAYIVAALEQVQKRLRSGHLIVLGSTTYPGTTHELYLPILTDTGLELGTDFCLAFGPERIDPANKEFPIAEVPKVVGGETELCTRLACEMFKPVFNQVVPVSSSQAAEMVKLLENTFRAINIGLANEVALICDRLGLNVWEVIDAAATKPYGFMKFTPGPGLGGHCIPVDPNYLSWKLRSLNFNARFIELASDVNGAMPEWVVDRIARVLNRDKIALNGSKILLLGMAYKKNVSDTRESPALDLYILLEKAGVDVIFHDPFAAEVVIDGRIQKSTELTDDLLRQVDLAVVTTDHDEIDYGRVCDLASRVFDTRNATACLGERPNLERL